MIAPRLPPEATPEQQQKQRLAAWWLLLPVLVLAWPAPSLLAHDPYPLRTATGLTLLLLGPAVLRFAGLRSLEFPRVGALLGIPLAYAAIASIGGFLSDTSGLARAEVILATGFLAFACGASLSSASREQYVRATMALSLLLSLWAIAGFVVGGVPQAVGTLGDTGSLSQAALPGAAAALTVGLARRGASSGRAQPPAQVRWLALACVGAFVAHAFLAPVIAGAVALLAALLCFLRPARPARQARAVLPALGVLALVPLLVSEPTAEATGGWAVRARLWSTVPAVLADRPLQGLGPGQFEAAYPPYRDPAEIELSTHGRLLGEEIVVEHLHNDWLQGLVEWGVLGGGAWCGFLLLILFGALRGQGGPARGGALALLVAALFHSPLLANPVAAVQAFALFGMVAADATVRPRARAPWPWPLIVLAVAAMPAWRVFVSGRDLAAKTAEAEQYGREVQGSLEVLPSAEGHAILARWLSAQPHDPFQADTPAEQWEATLALRPWHTEALLNLGVLHARKGEHADARERWERVLIVDAHHPRALRNLARLEFDVDRPEQAMEHVLQLADDGRLSPDFTAELAANELLRGHTNTGAALLALGGAEMGSAGAEHFHAVAESAIDQRLADAAQMTAQRLWGHGQGADGNARQCVINLRQAVGLARRHAAPGLPLFTIELAAAEDFAGRPERSDELLADLEWRDVEPDQVAPFARAWFEARARR